MAMQNPHLHPKVIPSPPPTQSTNGGSGSRVVLFTTPQNYAPRLSHLLRLKNFEPLWCPTVVVETTPHTTASLQRHLKSHGTQKAPLEQFDAIAFTSRSGISAFSDALAGIENPPLSPAGETFTVSALGRDSQLLSDEFIAKICSNRKRIRVLIPPIATPGGLVDSLGVGLGRKVLCPVPLVVGITEPPVVPNFLQDLAARGWIPIRVDSYETRWAGPDCAGEVVRRREEGEGIHAVVFTSTGEVEGLLKSLREYGLDWKAVKEGFGGGLVVAAHGPVTAAGAERLGVAVEVVSSRFDSFHGVVDALAYENNQESSCRRLRKLD